MLADVLGVLWCWLAVVIGRAVHAAVSDLAGPGAELEEAGAGFAARLEGAADALSGLPFVGEAVAQEVAQAAAAAGRMAAVGQDVQDLVADLARWLGIGVAGLLVGLAVLVWVLPRLGWMWRAAAARRARDQPGGLDLLALRALTRLPVHRVVGAGAVDGWRRGDPETVRRLAALELGSLGLRPVGRDRPG